MVYLETLGIPEYDLAVNVELFGQSWKYQGFWLDISAKNCISNVIPKFESLFGKEFKIIRIPMGKRYCLNKDDSPLCTNEGIDPWLIVVCE
jgi:hypothetical protein